MYTQKCLQQTSIVGVCTCVCVCVHAQPNSTINFMALFIHVFTLIEEIMLKPQYLFVFLYFFAFLLNVIGPQPPACSPSTAVTNVDRDEL